MTFVLSELFRMKSTAAGPKHWPDSYGTVWKNAIEGGVYLHFDENDRLVYIGKAACLGHRLGDYFEYANRALNDECRIKDTRLEKYGVVGTRVIPLNGKLRFLMPALEWFLIFELPTPLNILGRNGEPVDR